ncbi:MAG TPA: DoxX family membrane protein [Planctomycetota bacterium]|nr:DoxX family membrane protein [Planctomycetota bacterium]
MQLTGKDHSLTFARIVLGGSALLRGISDTFGVWGGPHLGTTTADMAATTTVSPDTLFYVVSVGLMVLGLAMVLGVMTRPVAVLLIVVVVWHGLANHRFRAFFVQDQGCEHLLAVVALALLIARHGPGALKVEFRSKGK